MAKHGHKGGSSHHDHTGKVRGSEHHSYIDGTGEQDKHADATFKANNKKHGMSAGMSPKGEYGDGGESGAQGMGEANICDQD